MGEFAGRTFVQWARHRQFSPGRFLLVWTSLREYLPMDPSGGQTGLF